MRLMRQPASRIHGPIHKYPGFPDSHLPTYSFTEPNDSARKSGADLKVKDVKTYHLKEISVPIYILLFNLHYISISYERTHYTQSGVKWTYCIVQYKTARLTAIPSDLSEPSPQAIHDSKLPNDVQYNRPLLTLCGFEKIGW